MLRIGAECQVYVADVPADGVVILALCVSDLAKGTALIDPAHFLVEEHIGVVFGDHKDALCLLRGADEGDALRHGGVGGALGDHVEALFQGADREGSVLMEAVRKEHGVHIMLDEFIEFGIAGRLGIKAFAGALHGRNVAVANGDDLAAVFLHDLEER